MNGIYTHMDAVTFHPSTGVKVSEKILQRANDNGELSTRDTQLIREFLYELSASKHIGEQRKAKLMRDLTVVRRRFFDTDFEPATLQDLFCIVEKIKNSEYKPNTQHDYVKELKQFYTWMIEEDYSGIDALKLKKKFNAPPKDKTTTKPKDILTKNEIKKLLSVCRNSRDRAIIALLYDTGCRIGELARLEWKDLTFDKYGIDVVITDTKTKKERFARCITAREYLAKWKDDYPGDPVDDAPVFLTNNHNPLSYAATILLVRKLTERAGIKKRVHPHLFRKSKGTHMIIDGVSESIVKEMLWGNQSTNQLRTYIIPGQKHVRDEIDKQAGVRTTEERTEENPLKPRSCYQCGKVNEPTAQYCSMCGTALTQEAKNRKENLIEKTDAEFKALIQKNPEEAMMILKELYNM